MFDPTPGQAQVGKARRGAVAGPHTPNASKRRMPSLSLFHQQGLDPEGLEILEGFVQSEGCLEQLRKLFEEV